MHIGVIIASTRPNRNGAQIADWLKTLTNADKAATYNYIDLKDVDLPFLKEPELPAMGNYQQESTKKWSALASKQDGFIIILPEYNHSYPASIKNALDTLYAEWNKKPFAFVSYGAAGGVRSVEHLIPVLVQLGAVPIRTQVNILLRDSLNEQGEFVPAEHHNDATQQLLSEVKNWAGWLSNIRTKERV